MTLYYRSRQFPIATPAGLPRRTLQLALSRTLTAGADVARAVITALVPVERPSTGRTGDLVGLPDTRGIRGSCLANLVDRLLLDKAGTPFPLRALLKLRLLPSVRIKPVPGDICFFWGYRAIHTDETCDPGKVRATALFDDADPHGADRWKRKAGRVAA